MAKSRRTKPSSRTGSARRRTPCSNSSGELVNIDSGSYDKAGVEAVGRRLVRFFEENGLIVAIEPHETFAPAIHVRLDATRSNEKPIVLMGHRDTVFPEGRGGPPPISRVENGRAYGPCV